MICPEHPKYKALRKPLKTKKYPDMCDICYAIYLYKQHKKKWKLK